ncbi:MAG: prolyl oligopeptidase family serine peptidase [Ahrensia sp.]|nr:prolyl oligopeptidase family serine peptidase [Ahrensia sp.]
MKLISPILAALSSLAWICAANAGCATDEEPCLVETGSYHIALPEPAEGSGQSSSRPAIIWLHGAGGTGRGAMRNTGMVEAVLQRGYAFIAANGKEREGRFGTGWYFHPDWPKERNEIAFLKSVSADAVNRHGVDPERIILAGFSIGGSMTSYVACADPKAFAAFAPVAGSFWRPHPTDCSGQVRLLHTHGWRDTTVPLEGRPLRGGAIFQGDVWLAMQIWRAENGCKNLRPDSFEIGEQFWRRKWESCDPGTALEFALHASAHGIPRGWATMVIDWFEGLD